MDSGWLSAQEVRSSMDDFRHLVPAHEFVEVLDPEKQPFEQIDIYAIKGLAVERKQHRKKMHK